MVTTNVPARAPERQPSSDQNANRTTATWPREKKTRFAIKLGGIVPA
jgi:hypothetical protein